MEIEEEIYNKYRDTPFKTETHQNIPQDADKDKASRNLAKYNQFLENIKKSLREKNPKKISDKIKLRPNYDKFKYYKEENNEGNVNNKNDETKDDTMKDSINQDDNIKLRQQHLTNIQNNDKRNNVKYINDLFSKEIEYENDNNNNSSLNNHNNNSLRNSKSNNEKKVVFTNNCFDTMNNENNNNNNIFIEYENDNQYIKDNMQENNQLNQINEKSMQNNNNVNGDRAKNKDNFILTVLNNNDNNPNYKSIKEINLIKTNNDLETIDKKFRTDPNLIEYNDYNNNNKNNLNNDNNLNLNNNKNVDENDKEKPTRKYNFILTSISSKKGKGKLNSNDIAKLKNDLNPQGELIENNTNNNIPQNNPINEGLLENNLMYENPNPNQDQNEIEYENNKDKQCFYIKAEPIESTNNKNNNNNEINYPDEEANLGTSSECVELVDHNSEYTLQTGTNIDKLIKKKRKLSPLLVALLLGSAGLLFLLYKFKKLREILLNVLKMIPGFFKGLLGIFGADVEDFLEKYNDIYRFLGLIITIIFLWFLVRMLLKFVVKLVKKKDKKDKNLIFK